MLRTARSLPHKGFRHWASTMQVSPQSRQSATGPPGSYPDRTYTGKRRRAYDRKSPNQRSPPICWSREKSRLTGINFPACGFTGHSRPAPLCIGSIAISGDIASLPVRSPSVDCIPHEPRALCQGFNMCAELTRRSASSAAAFLGCLDSLGGHEEQTPPPLGPRQGTIKTGRTPSRASQTIMAQTRSAILSVRVRYGHQGW